MTAHDVLLVDDDETTNFLHRLVLGKTGMESEITVALDGRAALELLHARLADERGLPDIILLDVNMPRMNGFEFLDAFATLPGARDVRVVMVTTSLLPDDRNRALASALVSSFKSKPLSVGDAREILTGEA